MSKKAFPKVIKQGHTKATIYRHDNRESTSYAVMWYEGEVRKRKVFGDCKRGGDKPSTLNAFRGFVFGSCDKLF